MFQLKKIKLDSTLLAQKMSKMGKNLFLYYMDKYSTA